MHLTKTALRVVCLQRAAPTPPCSSRSLPVTSRPNASLLLILPACSDPPACSELPRRLPTPHTACLQRAGPPRCSRPQLGLGFSQTSFGTHHSVRVLVNGQYQVKNIRWTPVFALETGGSPNSDGQDFEDTGFLGRTRLGRLIRAAVRELLQKLNSGRTNSPTKIFLVLLGFYTANALATILGQTGDWDVLVAAVVVAAIEGIGMLMYRKPVASLPGRFQSLIGKMNYWKAGVCLGLFVDAFKVGS
ncbi:hypothetical protein PR202_gb16923 [Eleusine coracana subsp. coracana]|uniref:Ycf20-like protein n=1 Tax=Eleusine coracana subsp. coracana TaxID=191504 RepID=A0AAV5F1M9_ELECO|nr:hypothetical protein PR202_gb16923 [Eleusine coracana subsp. coracana]